MKKNIFAGKLGRHRLLALLLPIAFVVLLLFQFWFTNFSEQKLLYVDLTSEGLYTLSPKMKEECAYLSTIDQEIKITFCAEPDALRTGMKARTVHFMSLALQKLYPEKVKVEYVNLRTNPTAVNVYKTTSLSEIKADNVIISYGDAFRIATMDTFWTNDGEGGLLAYNGEYKMATLIHSLTAREKPVAYFISNHGEQYFDVENKDHADNVKTQSLYQLLISRGLVVKTLDLSKVTEIPEDCALLIINNPQTDFVYDPSTANSYVAMSETEMIDRYLVREQGSLMVAKDYRISLPNLEDFLFEWGFVLGDKQISDEGSYLATTPGDYSNLVGKYETEENTYAYAIYGQYASLSSAPRMVFTDAGEIRCAYDLGTGSPEPGSNNVSRYYASFFSTSEKSKLLDANGLIASDAGVRDICAIALRYGVDSTTLAHSYSYVFCANSAGFFSEQTLGNPSFANFDITSALVENISREDVYASMDLGGTSMNSASYGGKQLYKTDIAVTTTKIYASDGSVVKTNSPITAGAKTVTILVALLIPFGVAITGTAVYLRRKFR